MTDARSRNRGRRSSGAIVPEKVLRWFTSWGDECMWPWNALLDEFRGDLQRQWEAARDGIMPAWIATHPGSRPRGWWWHDAPELRKRLGGIGDAQSADSQLEPPAFERGLPLYWVTVANIMHHPGRAPIDSRSPPRFESEAAYLDRIGLLSAAERKRLPPSAFNPEFIPDHGPVQ